VRGCALRRGEFSCPIRPVLRFTIRDGWVSITDLKQLTERAAPLLDTHEQSSPAYSQQDGRNSDGVTGRAEPG
jgi:hypothetical protein